MKRLRWVSRLFAGVIFCGIVAPMGFGQEMDDKVRLRLREMKGDDDQAAMVAEMELLTMGDKALEPLKKIIDDAKDAERAEAMKVYPKALEKAKRLTRVSLDFDDARISDVINELNKQCKTKEIEPGSMNNSKVTIQREKVPYCRALAEICQQVDGTPNNYNSAGKIVISRDTGSNNRPISEDWGNMIILDSIYQRNSLDYDGMKRNGSTLDLKFQGMMDPAMKTYMGGFFKDVEGMDDAGRPLAYIRDMMGFAQTYSQTYAYTRRLLLSAPAGMKKIASLKGKMSEYVGNGFETWMMDDVTQADGKSRDFGSLKLVIRSASLSGSRMNFSLSLSGVPVIREDETGSASRYLLNSFMNSALKVESADGKTSWRQDSMSNDLVAQDGNNAMQYNIAITMVNPGGKSDKPPRIRIKMPTKMQQVWVGFEFKDIDLFRGMP